MNQLAAYEPGPATRSEYTVEILRYFEDRYLPDRLQAVSRPFAELAHQMAERLPNKPESTVCLRKLLEAKECAVRAAEPASSPAKG